jgi:hypothetical protein
MRLAGYVACTFEIRNYPKNLFAKPYGKREFGRPKRRLGSEGLYRVELARGRIQLLCIC